MSSSVLTPLSRDELPLQDQVGISTRVPAMFLVLIRYIGPNDEPGFFTQVAKPGHQVLFTRCHELLIFEWDWRAETSFVEKMGFIQEISYSDRRHLSETGLTML